MERSALTTHSAGTVLRLRVTPNAARTGPDGLKPDAAGGLRLGLRVKAPPVEGKANRAALAWAARAFGLKPSAVGLLRGERGRQKDLLLGGLDRAEAERRLEALLGPAPGAPS